MKGQDTTSDFTSQVFDKLRVSSPIRTGSFGEVYRCTIESSKGETEAAVKVFKIDPGRDMEKIQKGIRRELKVWLSLKHSTIVPLLGTARVKSPLLALVSLWMPSGTLSEYLEKQATTITPSARVGLVKGIAEGLDYLHTKNVIHGDLHPGNVLIDVSGNPCLTDFGLATIAEDPELQWTTTTMGRSFDCRWRAPELIGIEHNPERPTFKSDIYSFGGVMIFIVSGDIPWKEKKSPQICIELSRKVTPTRPNNVSDNHWHLIQKCWSFYPRHRPGSSEVLQGVMPRGIAAQKGTRDILQEYRGRPTTHGEREGGKFSAVSRTASMIQDSRDMPGPSCMRNTDPQGDYLGRPRNVVLYGECGMGLINLITRRNITTTSLDARTATHPPYHVNIKGQCFKLWDTTAGVNERSRGAVPASVAEKNWTAFLRGLNEEDGVHLIIYCVRGTREIGAPQTNYKTFSSVIGDSKVPAVIAVTCSEDLPPVIARWWDRNKDKLAADGMHFSDYACVTTLGGGPEAQSYEDICRLILDHCSVTPHKTWGAGIKDERNFLRKLACLSVTSFSSVGEPLVL